MSERNNDRPAVQTVSFILMALIAGGSILMIVVILALPSHVTALRGWLGTLAVIATLAIACNQAVYSLKGIEAEGILSGIDGLGKAVTQCAAPFAAVMVAVIISEHHSWLYVLGIVPFTAQFWASLCTRWRRPRQ